MTRRIDWQRTGGRTHRVTITSDEKCAPEANVKPCFMGWQNTRGTAEYHQRMALQAMNVPADQRLSPERDVMYGVTC